MAVVEAAAKIPATVGAISKLQSNEYGDYRSVLFEGAGLEGGKLWRKMPPEQAERFQRGDAVNLIKTTKKGKPAWDIEILGTAPTQQYAAPATPTAAPASDQMAAAKRAIAADISTMADLYGFCYSEAKRVLEPHGATTEGIQGCAFRLWHHAKDGLR